MDFESLLSEIESVLEMDEQADRSIALDKIREAVTTWNEDIKDYEKRVQDLEGDVERYKERNNQLFSRVNGRPAEPEQRSSTSHSETLENALKSGTFFN